MTNTATWILIDNLYQLNVVMRTISNNVFAFTFNGCNQLTIDHQHTMIKPGT